MMRVLLFCVLVLPVVFLIMLMYDVMKSKHPKDCNFLNPNWQATEDGFYHTTTEKVMYMIATAFLLVMYVWWLWILFFVM